MSGKYGTAYLTIAGQVSTSMGAVISLLSSSLVVCIICRSQRRLSTTYHRLVFLASIGNIISSTAIALTTLLMPKDVIYPYQGRSYGTTGTCEAQSFMFLFGTLVLMFSYCTLYFFYVLNLFFGVTDDTFSRKIEVICIPLVLIYSAVPPIVFHHMELLNPNPYDSFCSIGPYPLNCVDENNIDCIRGDVRLSTLKSVHIAIASFIIGMLFFTVALSMGIIVRGVHIKRNDSDLNVWESDGDQSQGESTNDPQEESVNHQTRRASMIKNVSIQAITYMSAYILTWSCLIITFFTEDTDLVQFIKMIFQPLQGFFHAIIFIYHGALRIRESMPDLSKKDSLLLFIFSPSQTLELIIPSIELIQDDEIREIHSRETLYGTRSQQSMRQDLEDSQFSSVGGDELNRLRRTR